MNLASTSTLPISIPMDVTNDDINEVSTKDAAEDREDDIDEPCPDVDESVTSTSLRFLEDGISSLHNRKQSLILYRVGQIKQPP